MASWRYMQQQDASAVLSIYSQGIESGVATFEIVTPAWAQFEAKYLSHSRLVAVEEEQLVGWAAISPVSQRPCYRGVAEVSIYVGASYQSKGIGKLLLENLIHESENNGIWSWLSVMHQENTASVYLHEKCGFRLIGYRERIAQLHGVWISTIMMERRSSIIGV